MELGRNWKRILSTLLAFVMVLSWVPVGALTAQAAETGLCEHHPEHTPECGYQAADPEAPCAFQCQQCAALTAEAPPEMPPETTAEATLPAATEETVPETTAAAVPEEPSRLSRLEALIAALPPRVTKDNREAVTAQLQEIQTLYAELTEAEQEQVDMTPCVLLQGELDAASVPQTLEEITLEVKPLDGKPEVDGKPVYEYGDTVTLQIQVTPADAGQVAIYKPQLKDVVLVAGPVALDANGQCTFTVNAGDYYENPYGIIVRCVDANGTSKKQTNFHITVNPCTHPGFKQEGNQLLCAVCGKELMAAAEKDGVQKGIVGSPTLQNDFRSLWEFAQDGTSVLILSGGLTSSSTLTVKAGTNLTLRGAGSSGVMHSSAVQVAGTFTVESGALQLVDASNNIEVVSGGVLAVSGGSIYATGKDGVIARSGATVRVSGGIIQSTGGNGVVAENSATVHIFGGTIQAGEDGVVAQNGSTVSVSGGTIEAGSGYTSMRTDAGATVRLSGGTYTGGQYAIKAPSGVGSLLVKGWAYQRNGNMLGGSELTALQLTPPVEVVPIPLKLTLKTPEKTQLTEGYSESGITLETTITAEGEITYQWFQDGNPIADASSSSYTIPAGLAPGSYGYSCAATYQGYTVNSNSVTIEVLKRKCAHDGEILDSSCTICGEQMTAQVTAGGNTSYYATFEEAWAAANASGDAQVRLLRNAQLSNPVTVTAGSSITLEMEPGAELSGTFESVNGLINVAGTLTANDCVLKATGTTPCIAVSEGGTANISGGELTSTDAAGIVVFNSGTANISGGTFKGKPGLHVYSAGAAAISGGTFAAADGASQAITAGNPSNLLAEGLAFKKDGQWLTSQELSSPSISGTVTVENAPMKITRQPEDVTLTYGYKTGDHQLTVAAQAVGDAEIHYGWFYGHQAVGTDQAVLEIPAAPQWGTYRYRCVLTCDGYTVNSREVTVTVEKAPLTIAGAELAEKVYDGTASATVTGVTFGGLMEGDSLTLDTHYTATAEYDDANAGRGKSATVTVTLKEDDSLNYTLPTPTARVTGAVTPKPVTDVTVELAEKEVVWDGTALEPAISRVTFKDGDITGDLPAEQYAVAYSENTDPGEATVTVTGTGNYSFTASANFTILCPHPGMGEDGSCTVCGEAIVATVEADSTVTYYTDITSAWNYANGKTAAITMLQSQTVNEMLVMTSGNVTLTMVEGVKLSGAINENGLICIKDGILTLDGCTIESQNARYASVFAPGTEGGGTVVNIRNCNISGQNCSAVHTDFTTVKIYSGIFSGKYGLRAYEDGATVNLYGGTFSGESDAVYIVGMGSTLAVGNLLADGYAYKQDGVWVTDETVLGGKNLTGTVTVLPIPVKITAQPQESVEMYYGIPQSLSVTAEALAPAAGTPAYQWYEVKDGTQFPIDGAAAAELDLSQLGVGTHSVFCRVTLEDYSVDSSTATVTILQSGTNLTAESDKTEYAFFDTITVTAKVASTGMAPDAEAPALLTAADTSRLRGGPTPGQVAVYADIEGTQTQVCDPQTPDADGACVFTIPARDLGAGAHTLTVKFAETGSMAGAETTVAVTVAACTHPAMDGSDNCTDCGELIVATVEVDGVTTNYTDIDSAWAFAQKKTAAITLLHDAQTVNRLGTSSSSTKITMNAAEGVTLTQTTDEQLFFLNNYGSLTLNGGTYVTTNGICVYASSGHIIITGGTYQAGGDSRALSVGSSVTGVELSGGKFISTKNSIECNPYSSYNTLGKLLAEGYAYKTASGWLSGDALNQEKITGTVEVLPAPLKITKQPTTATAMSGVASESLSVTAEVSTDEDITYQWYCEDGSPVTGQTTNILTVPESLAAGEYKFYCAVTCDGYTVNSGLGTVTVRPAAVTITVMVSANDSSWGTVSGGGKYTTDDPVTVTAKANSGYKFVRWTEGGTTVSTSPEYTFTAEYADKDLVAVFAKKKISVRSQVVKGTANDVVTGGVQTDLGATHTITITPKAGYTVVAGYFAGKDYYAANPGHYDYESMTLEKRSTDPDTGAVTYQFTATEYIPIDNDPNYDYICLYFYCAKAPTYSWFLDTVYGEATAPAPDGSVPAVSYESQHELCADPGKTGYYNLDNKNDRAYLGWDVEHITNANDPTEALSGTVSFENNRLHYTPTYAEAGKTVRIQVRPKLGETLSAEQPLVFEITVGYSDAAKIKDVSETLDDVRQPEALADVQETVKGGSHYTAVLTWSPETSAVYGFNTVYTATLTLTPEPGYSLHSIQSIQHAGWTWKTGTTDGGAVITKQFPATRKEEITSLGTIEDVTLEKHTVDADEVIAGLPTTITAVTETGTASLPISWSCEGYDTTPNAENTFSWTAACDESYDASGVALTGSITVTNPDALPVGITGTDKAVTYDGSTIDVSGLFAIDENAGAASYRITGGTGEGTLRGNALTVTKVGTFTVTVQTAANGIYAAGEAPATLTVNPKTLTPLLGGTAEKVYDGATAGPEGCAIMLDGIVEGDDVSASAVYSYDSADAGERTITATDITLSGADSGNYVLSTTEITAAGKIAKRAPVITFENQTITYGDTPTEAAADSNGTITYTYEDEGNTADGWPVNAGTYTVTATVGETANYLAGSKTIVLTINRKPIQVPEAVSGLIYIGEEQTGVDSGTGYTLEGNTGTDAGNYTATAALDGNHCWADGGTEAKEITWSIARAEMENVQADGYTGTYDGNAHGITISGYPSGVTARYGTEDGAYDLAEAPTYTNAGAYTVYYELTSPNYETVIGSAVVAIERKAIDYPVVNTGLVYNGQVQTGVEAGTGYSLENAVAKNAGVYTATAVLDANHKWSDGKTEDTTVDWSIGKKKVTVSITADGGMYNGKPFPASAALDGTVENETVSVTLGYTRQGETAGSAAAPTDVGGYTVTAAITDSNYTLTGPNSKDFTITPASIEGGKVTVDGSYTYTGAAHTPEPVVTLGSKTLVKDTDYTVTYADNVNAGTASVTVTGTGNYTGEATGTFAIGKAVIVDVSATVDSVSAPEAQTTVQSTVTSGSGYTGTITWSPEASKYGFNTAYTATLALTPDGNHKFDGLRGEGWTVTVGEDGAASLTKTFPITRKEKITALAAIEDVMLETHTNKGGVIAQLPTTVNAAAETGGTVPLNLAWDCESYGTAPWAENTFTWTVTDAQDYDASGVALSGSITVTNPGALPVTITGTDKETVYDGGSIDVSELFAIDQSAGAASYSVTGIPGAGTLSGSALTVTRAGTFTVTVHTAAKGIYAAGEASATLTVDPKTLTPHIEGTTEKIYDGASDAPDGLSIRLDGVAEGDDVSASATYSYDGPDAGDRTITATGITLDGPAAGCYTLSGSTATAQGTIRQAVLSITASGQTIRYGGSITQGTDQVRETGLKGGDALDSIILTATGDQVSEENFIVPSDAVVKNGGTDVTANYRIRYQPGKLTIERLPIPVPAAIPLSYNGREQTGVESGMGYTLEGNTGAEAGGYTATATPDSNHCWEDGGTEAKEITWSIDRAEMKNIQADGYTGTYDGNAHGITISGYPSGVTVRYGTEDGAYDLAEAPTYTNAGAYTVYYKLTSPNYETVTGSVTVTIERKTVAHPTANTGLSYNGQEQTGVGPGEGYTLHDAAAKNAGAYTATAVLDVNHKWSNGKTEDVTIDWSIGKKEITAAITANGGVYSGKPFPASAALEGVVEGETVPVTLTYTREGETAGSVTAPTDVGSYTVTATITDSNYELTGVNSKDFTINPANVMDAKVTVDGSYIYSGAAHTPSPTVTLGNETLVKGTDYTVSYAGNVNAGTAAVTVTGTGNYTGEATGTFVIGKAVIADVSATVDSVSAPEAQTTVQSAVTSGSGYTGTITWSPEASKYGFNTAYTATLALTPDGNHKFDGLRGEGWTVTVGENGAASLTKTFPTTRKEAVQSLETLGNVRLTSHGDQDGAIAQLPKTITAAVETGTASLPISWSCETYDPAPNAENAFTWTVTDVQDYDASGVALSGAIAVTNPAPVPVAITSGDKETAYTGSTVDVSELFVIDQSAGEAAYSITGGTGTGNLNGTALTVTKAGTFTVTVYTAAHGIYDAGTATATLTVNKGTGTGAVTMEGWTYGGTAKDPVPVSDTNGTGNVTYTYSMGATAVARPTGAGTYTVTAAFGGTDLYNGCTASADFTIAPKPITVTITPNGGVYGGEIKGAAAELDESEIVPGDTAPAVALTYTGKANDGTEVNSTDMPVLAGTYTVTAAIPEGSYVLTGITTAQFQISRAESGLTVEAVTAKTYGDEDFDLTIKQDETGAVAYASGGESVVTVDENGKAHIVGAGTAKLTVTAAETANYKAGTADVTVTVAKKPVTVTVDSKVKTYGEPDPELTYTVGKDALVGNDTLMIGLKASGKDVGTYDITAPNAARDNPNYEITVEKGQLTIVPRTIDDAQVILGPVLTANGKPQTQTVQSVTVKNSKGEVLNVTYTVTGGTQTAAGGYEMTITGTGNFTGTKKQSFAIAPGAGQPMDTDSGGNPVLGDGRIIEEVSQGSGAPITSLGTSKAEIIEMLTKSGDVTAQELAQVADGSELKIIFLVKQGVTDADLGKIKATAKGYTVGSLFDITMYKQMDDGEKTYLHETSEPITLAVQVPDSLLNTRKNVKRTFWIVRCHDGDAEFLPTRYNNRNKTLTFETDRFSGYAIVYKDAKISGDAQNTATGGVPRTGDSSNIELWITVMALSAVGIGAVMIVKRKKRK